jgi:hypothetical protein
MVGVVDSLILYRAGSHREDIDRDAPGVAQQAREGTRSPAEPEAPAEEAEPIVMLLLGPR